jgi:hypothetical protein
MNAPSTESRNANGLLEQAAGGATGQQHDTDHNVEKTLATIRAKLWIAGGQTLHVATDGDCFVVTPWQQITKFDDLASLQAYADRGAR